jgi:hypothetical protein
MSEKQTPQDRKSASLNPGLLTSIDERKRLGYWLRLEGSSSRVPDIVYQRGLVKPEYWQTVAEITLGQITDKRPERVVVASAIRDENGQAAEFHDFGTGLGVPTISAIDGRRLSPWIVAASLRLATRVAVAKGWFAADLWIGENPDGDQFVDSEALRQSAIAMTATGMHLCLEIGQASRILIPTAKLGGEGIAAAGIRAIKTADIEGVDGTSVSALEKDGAMTFSDWIVPHWVRTEMEPIRASIANLIATFPMIDRATAELELSRFGSEAKLLAVARHTLAKEDFGANLPIRKAGANRLPERNVAKEQLSQPIPDSVKAFFGI